MHSSGLLGAERKLEIDMATHIYGLLSLILAAVSLVLGFQSDPTWRDILLWVAGWMSALMFALFLRGALRWQKRDSETIGELRGEVLALEEKVKRLKHELSRRNQTLDVLAGFGGITSAKVRKTVEGSDEDNA